MMSPNRRRGWLICALLPLLLVSLVSQADARRAKRHHLGTVYAGPLNQRIPMVLTLTKTGKLARVALATGLVCDDGSTMRYASSGRFLDQTPFQLGALTLKGRKLSKTGRFKVTGTDSENIDAGVFGFTVVLQGQVRSAGASGTLGVQVLALVNGETHHCDSGRLPWALGSAHGRIFGGTTAQDAPIEVKVSGSSVSVFAVDWFAPCTSGTAATIGPSVLTGLPLSGGNFSKTFTQTAPADPNGITRSDTAIAAGTVAGRKASGTYENTYVETDSTGAVVDTCATGSVSWNATSS